MYLEQETGKKRKLDAVVDAAVETDEQLARRLHEELNSLTRHASRRSSAPVYAEQRPHQSKAAKAGAGAKGSSKQQHAAAADDDRVQDEPLSMDGEAAGGTTSDGGLVQQHKSDRPRKRSMLNRELAMLVTDLVESHVKPVPGARLKLKDEQDSPADQQDHDQLGQQQDQQQDNHHQHHQQQQQQDDHSAAAKHESSSSLSEQERLAVEHLHAAAADAKPINKLLSAPHLSVRTGDSGGAGADSCTTATSSGKASSSSHEHDQQQSSGQQQLQQAQQQQQSKQLQRQSTVSSAPAAGAARTASGAATAAACGGSSRPTKIPKLPMVLYGKKWYRAKVLKDGGSKVMLEYQGFSHEGGPFWLAKDHPRIWRGSYKGRDWRYLGDGAWEPRPGKQENKPKFGRQRSLKRGTLRGGSDAGAAAAGGGAGASAADSDNEQPQQHSRGAAGKRAAAAAAAAADGTATERDTVSTDQEEDEEEENAVGEREPLTVDSPSVPVAKQQHSAQPAETLPEPQQHEQQQEEQQQEEQQQEEQQQEEQQLVDQEQVAAQPLSPPQPPPPQQRRRRQSEADAEADGKSVAHEAAAAARISRKGSGAAAQSAEQAVAAAAAAGVAVAVPGESSSDRQPVDAVAAADRPDAADKADEAASAPAEKKPRGRQTRSGRASRAADVDGGAPAGKRGSRGARSRSAAAQSDSASGKQEREQQQPTAPQQTAGAAASKVQPGLQIDAGRSLKHSSSSEGLPMSPTSPVAGGSPRAHRRKGVPQRARLDSGDLQQPAKKGKRANAATSSKSTGGGALQRSNSDFANAPECHLQQQEGAPEQQQQQQQLHLGWKGGWKGAYKKGMWQSQGQQQQQQEGQEQRSNSLPTPKQRQQHGKPDEPWLEQQQQQQLVTPAGAVREGHMHVEHHAQQQQPQQQQQLLGGSDPEDLEAACVLVGASMGRAHSGELYGYHSHPEAAALQHQQQLQHHGGGGYGCARHSSDDVPVSPRGSRQSNGRRRGHNWSKPLNRPPRPPAAQQQQQSGGSLGRRHSLNGSISSQQQHQLLYGATAGSSGDLCNNHVACMGSHDGFAMLSAAAVAMSPRMSRQGSLAGAASLRTAAGAPGAGAPAPHRLSASCLLLGAGDSDAKQQTLCTLLDAVGEVQASSTRADLRYPLQYSGLPLAGSEQGSSGGGGKGGASLQFNLPHLSVSAAAAALLAAVPSLDAVQQMAAMHCALNGASPALFR